MFDLPQPLFNRLVDESCYSGVESWLICFFLHLANILVDNKITSMVKLKHLKGFVNGLGPGQVGSNHRCRCPFSVTSILKNHCQKSKMCSDSCNPVFLWWKVFIALKTLKITIHNYIFHIHDYISWLRKFTRFLLPGCFNLTVLDSDTIRMTFHVAPSQGFEVLVLVYI